VTTGGNINHEESFSGAKISARGIADHYINGQKEM
jgi:hypothetical protein